MLFSSIGKFRAFPAEQGKDVGWGGGGAGGEGGGRAPGGGKENWALGWGHGDHLPDMPAKQMLPEHKKH